MKLNTLHAYPLTVLTFQGKTIKLEKKVYCVVLTDISVEHTIFWFTAPLMSTETYIWFCEREKLIELISLLLTWD